MYSGILFQRRFTFHTLTKPTRVARIGSANRCLAAHTVVGATPRSAKNRNELAA